MKFRFILCAAIVAGFSLSAVAEAAPLIGYVDMQKAILRVEEGQAARATLEKTLKKKQKELTKKKDELEAFRKKLGGDKLTPEQRKQLSEKGAKLQQEFMKEQNDLQKLERDTLGKIMTKMRTIIKKIGKKGEYDLILEISESRLLFAQEHLDLTNEVIRTYNKTHPKKKGRK